MPVPDLGARRHILGHPHGPYAARSQDVDLDVVAERTERLHRWPIFRDVVRASPACRPCGGRRTNGLAGRVRDRDRGEPRFGHARDGKRNTSRSKASTGAGKGPLRAADRFPAAGGSAGSTETVRNGRCRPMYLPPHPLGRAFRRNGGLVRSGAARRAGEVCGLRDAQFFEKEGLREARHPSGPRSRTGRPDVAQVVLEAGSMRLGRSRPVLPARVSCAKVSPRTLRDTAAGADRRKADRGRAAPSA